MIVTLKMRIARCITRPLYLRSPARSFRIRDALTEWAAPGCWNYAGGVWSYCMGHSL